MSLYYRAEEYHPVFIGGKKNIFFLVYISDVRGRMEYEYWYFDCYIFKNVIQVRNLTCTPCFYQVKIFSKKCTCVYLIQ